MLLITVIDPGGEEPRATIIEAIACPQFKPGTSVLFDVRLSTENSSSETVRSAAHWLSTLRSQGISSRCAIVVGPRAYQFGLARMAGIYLELLGMCLEIFRDIDEAERCLSDTTGQDRYCVGDGRLFLFGCCRSRPWKGRWCDHRYTAGLNPR